MRRSITLVVAALALTFAFEAQASQPILVATTAAYVSPVLRATPGSLITFKSADPLSLHSFTTPDLVCLSGSDSPGPCNVTVGALSTSTIFIDDHLTPGTYDFYCTFHLWMRGKLLIEAKT